MLYSKLNHRVIGMKCVRCQAVNPLQDYFEGCPACFNEGYPASVAPHYTELPSSLSNQTISEWLSYPDTNRLCEGHTPLSWLPRLASSLGVSELYTKNEFANPAGSHKDRMAATIVARALDIGARTIAVASSGNAGVSTAAYAANAGLDCVVVTTPEISPNWRRAIEMHGARTIATRTSDERWELIAQRARAGDWYPATNYLIPPVGSNPFGVDGYRAVAFELYLQLADRVPTDIVVPTARGDLLWGIAKGYRDLVEAGLMSSVPRVHAVEPAPRIISAQAGQGMVGISSPGTNMVSIGGDTATLQSLDALSTTGGSAVSVSDDAVAADQVLLGRNGLYLELSSVATITGLRELIKDRRVVSSARVVLIATSHGYKEYAKYDAPLPVTSTD